MILERVEIVGFRGILKNERIIALYSLLLISLQKQQNQIISMINYFLLRLKD